MKPGEVLGEYRLGEPLGEGAVGRVVRALREPDGQTVALKLLKEKLSHDETFRRRFLREARAAREVEHPNLVPVLDAGEAGGRQYIASRYVEGSSLKTRIAAGGPLPLGELVRLAADVAAALGALHGAGLVHRDVKPSNVILDGSGRALLTDFGLAKGAAYTVLTDTGRLVGTLDYLAPELIRGEPARPASDVYSFGCLLFEAATGVPPFLGRSFFEVGLGHLEHEPPDASARRSDLPPAFGWVLRKGLAKDPEERPVTATAYARLLAVAAAEPQR